MIGIVTPYKVNNYGTKLQAYAMQKLFDQYGGAEIVNFLTKSDTRKSALFGKMFSLDIWSHKIQSRIKNEKLKKNQELYSNLKIRECAINSFDNFLVKSDYVVGNKALNQLIKKYDYIVCGSDQLWAPRNVIADYFTLTWVPDNIGKISYAASFGLSKIPNSLKRKYINYLSTFDDISVRENTGKEIVESLIKKEATVTLDPTLMLDADTWMNVAQKSKMKIGEKYIFCYLLGTNPRHRLWAKQLAKETGCKIVILPHFIDYCKEDSEIADVELYDVTPCDFLKLILEADYIVTDSFHATVFSTIFNRKVAVFERFKKDNTGSTNSRIYSLIHNLNIEAELIDENSSVNDFINLHVDYEIVGQRLESIKKDSFEYIETALKLNKCGRIR